MQLYAHDRKNLPVMALTAHRQKNYRCMECGGVVRVRGGEHRRNHFFHLHPPVNCRQQGKSLIHLQVQWALQSLIPDVDSAMEHSFPQIGRIADFVWFSQNVVFEVQCSPITADEVLRRNTDYGRMGYVVVWILHERRFNRKKVTAAESVLRGGHLYFTDINDDGLGIIYDQFDVVVYGRRTKAFDPFPIEIDAMKRVMPDSYVLSVSSSQLLQKRLRRGRVFFGGDLIDRWLRCPDDQLWQRATAIEEKILPQKDSSSIWIKVCHFFVGFYRKVLLRGMEGLSR